MNAGKEPTLSPDSEMFRDGLIVSALALQCALVGKAHSDFQVHCALAVIILDRHYQPGEAPPALFFEDLIQIQRRKLKGYIKDVAMAALAKTIERNGGLGTLPKPNNL